MIHIISIYLLMTILYSFKVSGDKSLHDIIASLIVGLLWPFMFAGWLVKFWRGL